MSKAKSKDDLRPEYDLARLGSGVTGKYQKRAAADTNLVLLEPDVARAFPDAEAVNRALRLLIEIAASNGATTKPRPRRARPAAIGRNAKSPTRRRDH